MHTPQKTLNIFFLSLTIIFACVITVRAYHLFPIYRSSLVRGQVQEALRLIDEERGIRAHFFEIQSVRCRDGACRLTLVAQPNLLSFFDGARTISVVWNMNDGVSAYEIYE